MKPFDKSIKRIPASQVEAALGWALPDITGEHIVALHRKIEEIPPPEPEDSTIVIDEELELEPERLTVADLDQIRDDAHQEGLEQGRQEGLAKGHEEGVSKGHAEGLEKGMAEGREQGHQEGLAQGQQEIAQAQALLQQLADQLAPVGDQVQAQLESLVLDLVLKISSTVLQHEVATRPELIQSTITKALEQLPPPVSRVQIKLNPADIEYVEPVKARHNFDIELQAEETVGRGSCQLTTANTLIESDIQAAFQQVVEQFSEQLEKSTQEAG
ncbi:FliH/SctL family protein [Marinobacterium jannaschii]|uniref:FliH/SctL family protein n=1 Tax=Marinobacterium jannaschii TaxID=64970 RepID=UPI0004837186|nr:FliH/SctL family protein [Marinobacterium jannaschii]